MPHGVCSDNAHIIVLARICNSVASYLLSDKIYQLISNFKAQNQIIRKQRAQSEKQPSESTSNIDYSNIFFQLIVSNIVIIRWMLNCITIDFLVFFLRASVHRGIMGFPVDKTMMLRIWKGCSIQRVYMCPHSIVCFFGHDSIYFQLFFVFLLFLLRLLAMNFLSFHKNKRNYLIIMLNKTLISTLFNTLFNILLQQFTISYILSIQLSPDKNMINKTVRLFFESKLSGFSIVRLGNTLLNKPLSIRLTNILRQFYSGQGINISKLNKLSNQFQYTEQAYTPLEISQMVRQGLDQKSKQEIMHQLSLFNYKVLPFDYDYFQQALRYLINFQRHLKIDEIKIIYNLSHEYKVQSPIIQKHIQSQLFLKMYSSLNKQLFQYDAQLDQQKKQMLQSLQNKSQDYFKIIQSSYKEKYQQNKKEKQDNLSENQQNYQDQQQNQLIKFSQITNSLKTKPIYSKSKKKLNFKSSQVQQICNLILKSHSKNNQFLKLLIQTLTIRAQKQIMSPNFLLTYTALTINILQNYMLTFTQNPKAYTKRSIKRIYNLQKMYYFQIVKFIQQKRMLQKLNKENFLQFTDLISSFPIKRRVLRRQLGVCLIQKCKQQNFSFLVLQKFFRLNRYDNKLLANFQSLIEFKTEAQIKMLQGKQQTQAQIYKIDQSLYRQVKPKKIRKKQQGTYEEIDLTKQNQGQNPQDINAHPKVESNNQHIV